MSNLPTFSPFRLYDFYKILLFLLVEETNEHHNGSKIQTEIRF